MNEKKENILFWGAIIGAIGTIIQTSLALADHVEAWLRH